MRLAEAEKLLEKEIIWMIFGTCGWRNNGK